MNTTPLENFETPTNSKNAHLSLKRKSCPAKLECKTPPSDLGTPLKPTFASSRRPHRLSESQKAQLRQRRLEFQTTNTECSERTENLPCANRDPTSFSKEELIEVIKKSEIELSARNEHERKVKDLEDSIETWKKGFNQALGDLQSQLQAKKQTDSSKKSILQQLHVSSDVMKYIDDSDD